MGDYVVMGGTHSLDVHPSPSCRALSSVQRNSDLMSSFVFRFRYSEQRQVSSLKTNLAGLVEGQVFAMPSGTTGVTNKGWSTLLGRTLDRHSGMPEAARTNRY